MLSKPTRRFSYKLDVTLCRTAKVPAEMWKDVFQSLSRCQLDACGIVCRTWRNLVEDPSAPARHFEHVAFLPPNVLLVHPSHVSRPVKVEGPHGHYVLMDDGVYDDSPLAFFWNSDEARNRRADAPPQVGRGAVKTRKNVLWERTENQTR